MIDLDALVGLRAVATHGSVVAAAAATGFTPSAISQQVKRLERQTGVPLLERVGRGVMLTSHGQHLVDAGEQVLADLEQLEARLRQRAGVVAGRVRLAAFSTAMRGLVATTARDLRDAHPDLTLTLREGEPWDVVDLVASGQVELGIVHRWGGVALAVPDHVVATRLADDVADLIVHRDDPLASRARVTPHDLLDVDWIATPEGTICRQWLSRMYDGTGRPPRIAHVSAEFDSHLALVRAGLGVALVPRMGRAPLGDDLLAVPVAEPEPVRLVDALHRRTMSESPAVQAVLAAFSRVGR
ncbi:LysR family transcriptional regulator [Pimelobacter simplex]|uniref:LysR-family transcriptional regulator n=1 Tax=Nocardioides simplex TaxID=2045 RepID=A0A0A1DS24_NOCSI|nr:LysR family transcriptional regulator [Pimelobacter simplex]AIY18185.1 LysR-family transcriptional regulator [Pimelobacter simplex]MCG8153558.1 LysR family transcriptional regulator [Pimelobacter simplex]GEB15777.1 LysR family transcriptional regulator [Pimelobacter simplex]SFN10665.1 DNA-binding transcriptional regulator, LysR family [Pimelobacter simplex]